jgi:hypothetical protein
MDYGLQHILGNLRDFNSYDDMLEGPEAQKIRQAFDDDSQKLLCRTCARAQKFTTKPVCHH